MNLKTIILIFSLLFLPVVAAGQGKITPPQKDKIVSKKRSTGKKNNNRKAQQSSKTKLKYDSSTCELVYGSHRYKMVYVEGGSFDMGATPEQVSLKEDEKPVHRVTLSSFYIGQTEVPQWLWKAVMGRNPSCWKGDNLPVETVSWSDCQKFLRKLNSITGEHFLLPTEAQWEYAARGGNKSKGYRYSGSNELGAVGWYAADSGNRTHDVGLKASNELGLYDMSGNVMEWCSDWYGDYPNGSVINPTGAATGSDRVCRGGNWWRAETNCRLAYRSYGDPVLTCNEYHGLRLVM